MQQKSTDTTFVYVTTIFTCWSIFITARTLLWVYRQYIGRPYIALARQVCQYIAIYRTHSAHFYELRINYEDLGGPIFPVKIQGRVSWCRCSWRIILKSDQLLVAPIVFSLAVLDNRWRYIIICTRVDKPASLLIRMLLGFDLTMYLSILLAVFLYKYIQIR